MARTLELGRPVLALFAALGLLSVACSENPPPAGGAPAPHVEEEVMVEERIPIIPSYPCSGCHKDRTPNPQKRRLVSFHTVRNDELHHGDAQGWCYHCHSVENIDRLKIANGSLVTFDQAFLLCGSCHGDKLRDWKEDVHGKTRGRWNGQKSRLSCTACHSPHLPKFRPIVPEKPPIPPEQVGK